MKTKIVLRSAKKNNLFVDFQSLVPVIGPSFMSNQLKLLRIVSNMDRTPMSPINKFELAAVSKLVTFMKKMSITPDTVSSRILKCVMTTVYCVWGFHLLLMTILFIYYACRDTLHSFPYSVAINSNKQSTTRATGSFTCALHRATGSFVWAYFLAIFFLWLHNIWCDTNTRYKPLATNYGSFCRKKASATLVFKHIRHNLQMQKSIYFVLFIIWVSVSNIPFGFRLEK